MGLSYRNSMKFGFGTVLALGLVSHVNAIDVPFDPIGNAGTTLLANGNALPALTKLNWAEGNAFSDNINGFAPGTEFFTYYQATLDSFGIAAGNVKTFKGADGILYTVDPSFAGLPGFETFEWTVMAKFKERVQADGTLVPVDDPDNYFKVFFDTTPDANNLAGTGFEDGTIVIDAKTLIRGIGTFALIPGAGAELFDQAGSDDYAGQLTVVGGGGFTVETEVKNGEFDPNFIDLSVILTNGVVRVATTNSTLQTPFDSIDPSRQFIDLTTNTVLIPNIGLPPFVGFPSGIPNGAGSEDFQAEADANTTFNTVAAIPEPATAALSLMALAGLALRNRRNRNA